MQQPDEKNSLAHDAVQRLASAIAKRQSVNPAQTVEKFWDELGQAIQELAYEDFQLIDRMTQSNLLSRLYLSELGFPVAFSREQALDAGAFYEDAVDLIDVDSKGDIDE